MTDFVRWEIWVLDTDPSTFTFLNDDGSRLDLTGMVMRLAIEWAGGAILLITGTNPEIVIEDQSDPDARGQVTITLSEAQRELLPLDVPIRFSIQRVDGSLKLTRPYGEIIPVRWVDA